MRKTEIVPWTETWAQLYQVEAEAIRQVFGEVLKEIHHVGSTSVPAIGYAKPIVDILVVVADIEQVEAFNDAMTGLGYTPRGENGIVGRRYFCKGKEKRTHHVHIHGQGALQIRTLLDFKAYAAAHPEEAKTYGELKLRLLEQFPDDTHLYQEAKTEFVNQMVERALKWADQGKGQFDE